MLAPEVDPRHLACIRYDILKLLSFLVYLDKESRHAKPHSLFP